MAGFLVITGKDRSLGFRLAGIETRELSEGEDISGVLLGIQSEGKYGLVAVEDGLLEKASELAMRRLKKRGLPIIIPVNIPVRWEEKGGGESPIVRLIRRAIGYQIKIKR